MMYIVIFSANKERSDIEGYKQGYEAVDYNGYVWAIHNSPGVFKISENEVWSESGSGAIMKFIKWKNNGKDRSWLISKDTQ